MTNSSRYTIIILADFDSIHGGIAQLARAFGSYPTGRWFKSDFRYQRPGGQAVKTPPFHGSNRGSIPLRVTNKKAPFVYRQKVFFVERRVPLARNVMFPSEVMYADASDVCLRHVSGTHHITLRHSRNTSLFAEQTASLAPTAHTSLYDPDLIWYYKQEGDGTMSV